MWKRLYNMVNRCVCTHGKNWHFIFMGKCRYPNCDCTHYEEEK